MAKKKPTPTKPTAPKVRATAPPPAPVVVQAVAPIAAAAPPPEDLMPNIQLQGALETTKQPSVKATPSAVRRTQTVSVGTSPGRLYYNTVAGVTRCYERVGVAANGDEIYRDQTRY
jgi:hypothetical protein